MAAQTAVRVKSSSNGNGVTVSAAPHPAQEIQTAKTTSDLITATTKARDREQASADQYYAAGDRVYARIRGTKKWTLRIDKVLKARELRKGYYEAAAHIDEAARLLGVVIALEQRMLAEN